MYIYILLYININKNYVKQIHMFYEADIKNRMALLIDGTSVSYVP